MGDASSASMRDRFLFRASLAVMAGILLSGPLGVVIVEWLAPQPLWTDVETFALHYRTLQGLPYLFGFLLLGALVAFVARSAVLLRRRGGDRDEMRASLATITVAIFGTLVFVNYTLQLAWLPAAARARSPFVELVAMANPLAICWSFEMFAYAALALALWLVAPVLERRLTRVLFGLNVFASVGAAAIAAADPTWLLRPVGLVLYSVWNALLLAMMALAAAEHREVSISGRMWGNLARA
jgi:hypothetical protein